MAMKLLLLQALATVSLASLRGQGVPPKGDKPRPSAVTGCPASFKDCGVCKCVPEDTCTSGWCMAGGPGIANSSNVDPDTNVSMRRGDPASVGHEG
eukprot:Skav208587  [mRNA]  locus=scaffold3152:132097:135839:+ [translate_table: standard]